MRNPHRHHRYRRHYGLEAGCLVYLVGGLVFLALGMSSCEHKGPHDVSHPHWGCAGAWAIYLLIAGLIVWFIKDWWTSRKNN